MTWHNTNYGTTLRHNTEALRVESMNAILNQHFSIEIHDTYIATSVNRMLIKGWLAKLFPETGEWHNMSKPNSFWMQVYNDALCE